MPDPLPATPQAAELRQRIAQAIFVADEGPAHVDEWWDAGEYEANRVLYYRRANAVLLALGLQVVCSTCHSNPCRGIKPTAHSADYSCYRITGGQDQ